MQQPRQAVILMNDKAVLAARRPPRVEIAGAKVLESDHRSSATEIQWAAQTVMSEHNTKDNMNPKTSTMYTSTTLR